VGLLLGKEADPPVPLSAVIARELEIIGSHGMQAREYPAILKQMEEGTLQPEKMLGKILTLEEGAKELMQMGSFPTTGVSLIRFPD
jgi:alcohol dehydrogenase